MKLVRAIMWLALALAGGAVNAGAQSYSIDWYKIAGGGGTSTGAVYSVSGTVGQPDAGPMMAGGNYTVNGGFWGYIAAVQMPGSPLLTIQNTSTNTIAIVWPSPSTGFSLQANSNLTTTNWTTVATVPADNGTTKTVIVSPPVGNEFYRLVSQ